MRTITFEHTTNEWYEGDNPNELDNYDTNRVELDLRDGYWEQILYSFIRFLNTSGFRGRAEKPITESDIILELGGYTKEYVNNNYTPKDKKPFLLSPGVSVMEYDG